MTDAERRRAEWGMGGPALRDQRTRPMARALPDLSDPVWKLGLEVAHLVVDYVIGERGQAAVAVALLVVLSACSACATDQDAAEPDEQVQLEVAPIAPVAPHRRVTYFLEERPGCATEPDKLDAAAAGFALWQEIGVEVLEADGPPVDAAARRDVVSVCFTHERFWGSRIGSTLWSPDGVQITHPHRWTLSWVSGVAAHEPGHVILETGDHLAEDEWGVMNGHTVWTEGFTDEDLAFLVAHGWTPP